MPIATPQGTLDFKSVDKVTFVGASSNTVIDTTTGSLGVGVGVGGPTSNLHVVGHTRLEGDINMLHTSNTASIKLNSNVVTEFSRSKKLIKYPRVALTQNASNNGYTVFQSGTNVNEHRKAWSLFNNDVTTDDQYHAVPQSGESNPYNPITGAYEPDAGFEDGLGDVAGEYVYVVMPDKIKLQGVSVHPRDVVLNRSAESARFMGSNNGTTWVDLGGYADYVWASGSQEPGNFFTVDSNEYYNYIGVVWTKVKGGSGGDTVNMAEVQFFGVPEYDPEAHGTDVVVKSVPNVPNTDWLEVYYDGQDYTQMPTTVTDKSGNNRTGTPSGGVGFDTEYKAFTFDGVNDYISSPTTATLSNHTASMWIKFDSPAAWEAVYSIKPASGFDRNNFILYLNSTYFRLESSGNTGPYYDLAYNFVIGKWVHLTLVFRGSGLQDCEMYIDNVRLYPDGGQRSLTDDITITGTNTIYVGSDPSGYYLDGSIANFRLFNRALTTDEIWQLYAYQKEYFGHGDLGMTLKAGRLGIGTSEPRAMLDVRGDVNVEGLVNNAGMHWYITHPTGGNVAYTPTGGNWFSSTASNTIFGTVLRTENNAPVSAWNSSNGYFTAPEDGLYLIDLALFINGFDTSRWGGFQLLEADGTLKERQYTFYTANLAADDTVGYSKTVYMKTGESFAFYTTQGTVTLFLSSGPPGHTTMNIYKIS